MVAPTITLPITSTKKIKNIVLAIETAPATIPPNPKMAAMIAVIRNVIVHFSIK